MPKDWQFQEEISLDGGKTSRRYRKTILRVGEFSNPVTGQRFSITHARLSHFANMQKVLASNGVRTPVPLGHTQELTEAQASDLNRGWLHDLAVVGDELVASLDLVGPDAERLAAANDVSIYAPATWQDGSGNEYLNPIRHIALTTDPTVSGLGDFEAIAASLSGADIKEPTMPIDFAAIQESLGIEEDLNEDNGTELIIAAYAAALEAATEPTPEEEPAEQLEEMAASLATNPEVQNLVRENRTHKINALADRLSPAVLKGLTETFASDGAVSLSLGGTADNFDATIAALAKSPALLTPEQTGAQLSLSLGNPNDPANKPAERPLTAIAKERAAKASSNHVVG